MPSGDRRFDGGPRFHGNDLEGLQAALTVADGDIIVDDEAVPVEPVAGLVIIAAGIVIVDEPGRAAGASSPAQEPAVTIRLPQAAASICPSRSSGAVIS